MIGVTPITRSVSRGCLTLALRLVTKQLETNVVLTLTLDYRPNVPDRSIGSAGPKKHYELPNYIKSRMQYNRQSPTRKPILKSNFEDKSLSYGRKLHAAIYQRNQIVASSRTSSRQPIYQNDPQSKKKIGMPVSNSQPYLQQRMFQGDYHRSPYLKAFNDRQANERASDNKNYETPEALRLLKQKMPADV
jgi:hypothetical protein